MLSVLIPFYNEEASVELTISTVMNELSKLNILDFEIVAVDDGSKDKTWELLEKTAEKVSELRAFRFSRNFGKEAAVLCLMKKAKGEFALLMDGDLQHPPRYIGKMLEIREKTGCNIVDGVKIKRQKEGFISKILSNAFYGIFKMFSGLDLKNASDFKLLDRKAIDAFNSCPEQESFFRALSAWIGFKRENLFFDVDDRTAGKSKWSFCRLLKLSFDAMTSFSSAPLRIINITGYIFLIFAVILGVQTLVNYFSGKAAGGFTTVILLILLTGGCILTALGLIGAYLGRIYMEGKNRPRYIVMDCAGEKSQ